MTSLFLFAGIWQLRETIDNQRFESFAYAHTGHTGAGSRQNLLLGETLYARASVAEASAGFGDLASVGVSALSAGAHAEYGLNNSIGVYASVVRAEATVGPIAAGVGLNFDTHAALGVNGVSASVLGMGFSFGPRMQIQTPIFDIGITLW